MSFAFVGITLLFVINLLLRRKVKHRTAELLGSKNHLEATLNAVPDLLLELDVNGRCMSFHSPTTALLNFPTNIRVGLTVMDVWPPEVTNTIMAAINEAKDIGHSHGKVFQFTLAGDIHWFELSVAHKLVSVHGIPSFIMILHDITEHKAMQNKVERLSKIYAALSQCNQAIVRCKNEDDLYRIICNDAVKFGGMKMAWIGVLDQETQIVKPVASYVRELNIWIA